MSVGTMSTAGPGRPTRRCSRAILVLPLAVALTVGCQVTDGLLGNEDDNEKSLAELQDEFGGGSITFSGAITGRFDNSHANFGFHEPGPGWFISVAANDPPPGFNFSPNVSIQGLGSLPDPGSYSLPGGRPFLSETELFWSVALIGEQSQDDARWFVAESGTITIGSRTAGEITGTYEVQAREYLILEGLGERNDPGGGRFSGTQTPLGLT